MTFDDIVDLAEKAGCDVSAIDGREYQTMWCDYYQLERFAAALIQAGAASRDAEVQRLQSALADAEALELGTAERCDQLRAHINDLREALTHSDTLLRDLPNSGGFYGLGVMENNAEALASIPEQSLAEYRNKVIEDCAVKLDPYIPIWAKEIRAMKEQP